MEPPNDLRHSKGGKDKHAINAADRWLQWAYTALAESLLHMRTGPEAASSPDLDLIATPMAPEQLRGFDGLTEWIVAPGAAPACTQSSVDVKWLPPMTLLDLFQIAQADGMEASYPSFLRCFNDKWKKTLKFRYDTQHSKCADCVRFQEWRSRAVGEADVRAVSEAYQRHIRGMFLDRGMDERLAGLSEKSCAGDLMLAKGKPWTRRGTMISCIQA